MASPARPSAKRIAAAPPPIGFLTDDLLAEILLRLPTLADIGRAAASCAAFRRVAAGRAFLRRLRSVHPAPLFGLLLDSLIQPAEPPHSCAPYAGAFVGVADLSFSFVPGRWFSTDVRNGRVLLQSFKKGPHIFAVCDPLSRRYTLVPEIPGDRFAQLPSDIRPFLVPAGEEQAETSFRVVCAGRDADQQLVAFVFSSATGRWSSLPVGADVDVAARSACILPLPCGCAYGCFYWELISSPDKLIMFNTRSMEFSLVHIPLTHHHQQGFVIVEAGEGRLGMFTLDNSIISAVSRLIYAIQEIDEDGSSRWRVDRSVRLPSQHYFNFKDVTDRYLLLCATPWSKFLGYRRRDKGYFSFEFESMQIEKICALGFENGITCAKLFASYPPSLCLQSL